MKSIMCRAKVLPTFLQTHGKTIHRFNLLQFRAISTNDANRQVDIKTEKEELNSRFSFSENFPPDLKIKFTTSFLIYENFVSDAEEENFMSEFEKHFKRSLYEKDHWDNAIAKFRETEKKFFNKQNTPVVERIRKTAFPDEGKNSKVLPYTHVLDLAEDGHIKPHVDSVRFCGDRVAVVSLLTDSVARFRLEKDKEMSVDVVIPRLSLYVMKGESRYDFTHEILSNEESYFNGKYVHKGRRISVIRRNEP